MATTTSFLRLRRSPVVTADVDHVAPNRAGQREAHGPTVPTFLGWTPGIRSLLSGRVLPCGCLVGVYETRARTIVDVLDACGPACPHAGHRPNAILDAGHHALAG